MINYPYYYIVVNIILWNALFFSLLSQLGKVQTRSICLSFSANRVYKKFFFLFSLFAVFAFHTGDFAHYAELVIYIKKWGDITHLEGFYVWLARLLHGNYFLWRLVVWGCFFYLLYLTLKKLHRDNFLSLFLFCSILLPMSVEGRYVLGLMLFIYGFVSSLSSRGKEKFFSILLLLCSYFLHRSIVLLFFLIPLSFVRLNRKRIIILILLFPVFVYVFNVAVEMVLGGDGFITSLIDESARRSYIEEEQTVQQASKGIEVLRICQNVVYIGLLLFVVWGNLKRHDSRLDARVISLSFFICYISFILASSVINNPLIFRRYFILTPYPIILIASGYFKQTFYRSHLFWWFAGFCFVWQNFYMMLQMYYFSFR